MHFPSYSKVSSWRASRCAGRQSNTAFRKATGVEGGTPMRPSAQFKATDSAVFVPAQRSARCGRNSSRPRREDQLPFGRQSGPWSQRESNEALVAKIEKLTTTEAEVTPGLNCLQHDRRVGLEQPWTNFAWITKRSEPFCDGHQFGPRAHGAGSSLGTPAVHQSILPRGVNGLSSVPAKNSRQDFNPFKDDYVPNSEVPCVLCRSDSD
jgi:hypothetical protein